jgi:uracil-DNA glycosylase
VSLDLDKRQRAMLREMGVRVWQPLNPPKPSMASAEAPVAIDLIASRVDAAGATGYFCKNLAVPDAVPVATQARPAGVPTRSAAPPAALPTAAPAATRSASAPAGWQLGEAQPLYGDTALAQGPRWLVLSESGAAALQGPPFQGDAGKLLDNMLRAARLPQAGAVLLAPLARRAAGGSAAADFSAALAALLQRAQPDVVLVMGRLAAQALLQSTLPFNKLRGQVHRLHGSATVVTYDAPYLLRSPADKAKAWADLRLAMSLAVPV